MDTGRTEHQVTGSSLRADNTLTFYRRAFKILTLIWTSNSSLVINLCLIVSSALINFANGLDADQAQQNVFDTLMVLADFVLFRKS